MRAPTKAPNELVSSVAFEFETPGSTGGPPVRRGGSPRRGVEEGGKAPAICSGIALQKFAKASGLRQQASGLCSPEEESPRSNERQDRKFSSQHCGARRGEPVFEHGAVDAAKVGIELQIAVIEIR